MLGLALHFKRTTDQDRYLPDVLPPAWSHNKSEATSKELRSLTSLHGAGTLQPVMRGESHGRRATLSIIPRAFLCPLSLRFQLGASPSRSLLPLPACLPARSRGRARCRPSRAPEFCWTLGSRGLEGGGREPASPNGCPSERARALRRNQLARPLPGLPPTGSLLPRPAPPPPPRAAPGAVERAQSSSGELRLPRNQEKNHEWMSGLTNIWWAQEWLS